MNFNPDDFPGKVVMFIKKRREYNQLAKALDEAERRWYTGQRYTEYFPIHYGEGRCVDFNDGNEGSISCYKGNGYIILEWDDFEHEDIKIYNFNIDEYPGRYVMWLKTPEEYDEFASILSNLGRTWSLGESYESHCPFGSYDEFCINFNEGRYCSKQFYEGSGYEILEWSDFSKS